jgi:hypothetical protein
MLTFSEKEVLQTEWDRCSVFPLPRIKALAASLGLKYEKVKKWIWDRQHGHSKSKMCAKATKPIGV